MAVLTCCSNRITSPTTGATSRVRTTASSPSQGAVGNLYVFDARTMLLVQRARSLASGHYLVPYLDPTRRYVLMARHPQGHYEPVCYDQLRPANNLSIAEQREVWRAWQAP